MNKIIKIFLPVLVIIPYLIIFKAFFLSGTLSWGDSPFFYDENLKELFYKPLIWNDRNDNFGAPQGEVLWLYIPTFLYGVLNYLFGFNNDFLIRLIFYFPATILTLIGSWLFLGLYTKNIMFRFLGSFLYSFNTYFLVLIDGGQVGVALSYGLFPVVIFAIINFFHRGSFRNYLISLLGIFLISNLDLRIFILASFLSFLLLVGDYFLRSDLHEIDNPINNFKKIVLLTIPFLLINLYWIVSFFFTNVSLTNILPISDKNFITLSNSLFLFQPHFPLNEFGNLSKTPFYFVLILILIFSGYFFSFTRIYSYFTLLFLLFVFLAKGSSQPFGQLYDFFIRNIPFMLAFRDSSKFYFPLFLIASILLALSIEGFAKKIKKKKVIIMTVFGIYIYLLILIHPALLGNLTGVLGGGKSLEDYKIIYDNLNNLSGFHRTLWFNNRPQVAFSNWQKPALSATTLYKEIPFALMIEGEYDLFNYLHDPLNLDWFRLLGIKYVFFPEDDRKKVFTAEDKKNRELFLNFVDKINGFQRLNWQTRFPAYQIDRVRQHIFAQNTAFIIFGDSNIYKLLKENYNIDITSYGFIFLEDGFINPSSLFNLPKNSAVILSNDRSDLDLSMTFLQDQFIDIYKKDVKINWGLYKDNYLKIRNEFLKNGIRTKDLLFGRSIIFSSIKGEKISFNHQVKENGKYYFTLRLISATGSAGLKVNISGFGKNITPSINSFKWELIGPISLDEGRYKIDIENLGGFNAINTMVLISDKKLEEVSSQALLLRNHFNFYNLNKDSGKKSFGSLIKSNNVVNIDYSQIDPTEYRIKHLSKDGFWLVFSDHYDDGWDLENSVHMPFYSMINGFWIENSNKELKLKYAPQQRIDLAAKISLVSGIVLIILLISYPLKERLKK